MDSSIEDILKRMGWTNGLHLPVANEENKSLQHEVELLMLRKAKATQLHESEDNRYNAIVKHLKYVKIQNDENQKLLTTYKQHLDNQEHRFLVARSEKERIQQEIRQNEKKTSETEERICMKRSDIDKGMSRMEKMKIETSWDTEALKSWEESLKKRDGDNQLLKKFSKEDERKANELEIKRQNLQVEAVKRDQILKKAIADVVCYEQTVDRTDKIIKQQKEEYAALTRQWQEAVKILRNRDDGIDQMIKNISITLELLNEQQEKFDEQNNFLNIEANNNRELEHLIAELNSEGSRNRRHLMELIQYVLTLTNEVNTMKKTVIASANCLEKERAKGKSLTNDNNAKDYKIKLMKIELNNLQRKLNNVRDTSASAGDRAKLLEQIVEHEQRQTKILDTDIERMQSLLYRTQQQLNQLKNVAKLKEMEMHGCETSIGLLQKNAKTLYNELQKQKEINYDLDFSKDQMQSKLDKIEGNVVDEDDDSKLEKIEKLEKILSDENEVTTMLQNQISQIEEEMRRLSSSIQSDNGNLESLKCKLQYEVLSFEGGTKQIAVTKQNTQQKQVDENILRLRVNQLENIMKKENYNIGNLQRFRLELEMAMRERQIEINANRDILIVTRRNLDEEKSRLKRDIMSRNIKLDQLQKRFHIAMSALGKDEDGQPLSVTHFKIKNAQEKYMLQEEGDALDNKIRKAEKEIVAMENTLFVVNNANNTYKQSLSAVDEYDDEVQEMQALEKDISDISAIVRNKKKMLVHKKNRLKDLKVYLDNVDDERAELRKKFGIVEEQHADLQRYASEQVEKIERTQRYICSSMKHIKCGTNIEKYKKNLLIKQLQESNKSALHQIAEISIRHQDMTPQVTRYMSDHEIEMPQPPTGLTPSSSTDSTRSSEYYSSGPMVSSLFLTFDPNASGSKRSITSSQSKSKSRLKRST